MVRVHSLHDNLEHERDIYLGKDTVMAYAREEDKSCDYLEINEIAQLPDLKKDLPTKGKNIQESDLVFSSSSSHRASTCGAEGSRNFGTNEAKI